MSTGKKNTKKKPHPHAELIKAWADGAEIETLYCGNWETVEEPLWAESSKYRLKRVERYRWVMIKRGHDVRVDDQVYMFVSSRYYSIEEAYEFNNGEGDYIFIEKIDMTKKESAL